MTEVTVSIGVEGSIKEAQQLFWEIERLRSSGVDQDAAAVAAKLQRMARLHEEIATELFDRQDPYAWIDLFAAITAWGKAGNEADARRLLHFGEQAVQREEEGRESLLSELRDMERWLQGLPVVPVPETAQKSAP